MEIFGIDIGGSGIKGAPVNILTGQLTADRVRIPTPMPSKPTDVAKAVKELLDHFNWKGPVGCGFPTVITNGKARGHSNMDPEWVGVQIDDLFHKHTGNAFKVINDADAAGLAEMSFGAGKDKKGLVFVLTLGTGIGSGVFHNGTLLPNFELGRLLYTNGKPIEYFAADSARIRKELSYKKWGKRLDVFMHHVVRLFSPDLIILGGGASSKYHKFEDVLTIEVPILVAESRNNAGIIGAAMAGQELLLPKY
ncbi:polyphosphate--glucose phosphotransferase [Arundinibacter roseus]|uniref:ROK family protein n=1 Tax=Arundinibacter roseus TaxID=2070510 RepID=A0A4R4KNF4_9BACT|nr:ROK family protein [Arundinibacter roseus]TDB68091.1 ROK family protein [Arundinibacter roseus]